MKDQGQLAAKKKKGCNCKKSNCLKKYCECYNDGLGCNEICKCEDCKNNKQNNFSKNNEENLNNNVI